MKQISISICCTICGVLMAACGTGGSSRDPSLTPILPLTSTPGQLPSPTPGAEPANTPVITAEAASDPRSSDISYTTLLEQVKENDPQADFTALRLAYTKTEGYNPYDFEAGEIIRDVFMALDQGEYETALELAAQVMENNFILPDGHIAAIRANEGLNQPEEADYHRYILNGLIDSILASGDGQSQESAFQVVLIEEEYLILSVLGVEDASQGLTQESGHVYDVFEGVDGTTNDKVIVYFNIDIPHQWLLDSMTP